MYMNAIIVIIIFGVIGVTEIVPLVRDKKKKELIVYSIFFSMAFVLMLLFSLEVEIPQISKGIQAVVESVVKVK